MTPLFRTWCRAAQLRASLPPGLLPPSLRRIAHLPPQPTPPCLTWRGHRGDQRIDGCGACSSVPPPASLNWHALPPLPPCHRRSFLRLCPPVRTILVPVRMRGHGHGRGRACARTKLGARGGSQWQRGGGSMVDICPTCAPDKASRRA